MQITFNTEDSVDDLSRIHEILADAIKKKGGSIKVEQPVQPQQFIQPQQIFPQTQPVFQPAPKSSFADTLNQDRAMSMGLNVPRPQPQQVQPQQQQYNSEIDRVNAEYKRQYIEKKVNPDAVSKPSNPDIDMSNIYYSDKRKKF
jgi:hypothetical protein